VFMFFMFVEVTFQNIEDVEGGNNQKR
jgi:hypothetical protein